MSRGVKAALLLVALVLVGGGAWWHGASVSASADVQAGLPVCCDPALGCCETGVCCDDGVCCGPGALCCELAAAPAGECASTAGCCSDPDTTKLEAVVTRGRQQIDLELTR
jgi:hypothetical protein